MEGQQGVALAVCTVRLNTLGVSAQCAAGLSGCAPCRLCRHGHSASIHSRLRACGAARCACLRGIGARPIPAARAWRPSMPPNRRCRIGPASAPPQWTELANTLVLAAAGCANACRPQRWRFSPITSRRTVHGHPARHRYGASTPRLKTGAARCGRGVLACRRMVDLARVSGRAGAAFVRGCRAGPASFRCGSAQGVLVLL